MRTSDVSSGGFGLAPSPPVGLSFHAKIRLQKVPWCSRNLKDWWEWNRFKIRSLPSFCFCYVQQRSTVCIWIFTFLVFWHSRYSIWQNYTLPDSFTSLTPSIQLFILHSSFLKSIESNNILTTITIYQLHTSVYWLKAHKTDRIVSHNWYKTFLFCDEVLNNWAIKQFIELLKCEHCYFFPFLPL